MTVGAGAADASRRPRREREEPPLSADRFTTQFGAQSTAAEVVAGIDLAGRRAIIIGGASGIGVETARSLASA